MRKNEINRSIFWTNAQSPLFSDVSTAEPKQWMKLCRITKPNVNKNELNSSRIVFFLLN